MLGGGGQLADLVFILVLAAFFGLAALFVTACERIIGGEPSFEAKPEQPVAAPPAQPEAA